MKTIVSVLFIIGLISCNLTTTKSDAKNQTTLIDIQVTDNTDVYGSWRMCSISGGGFMTQYNVCPTVTFNFDGTGSVVTNASISERFNWTLKKGALTILYSESNSNHTFSDTIYRAFIGKKNNNYSLTIRQQKSGDEFYLS